MVWYGLAVIAGILAGCVAGLLPGVHPNLIATISLSLFPWLSQWFDAFFVALMMFSMALTNTFLGIIPSTFLGAPDSEMVLSVQPVHKWLQRGRGLSAIYLNVLGSFLTGTLVVFLGYVLLKIIPWVDKLVRPVVGYVLIGVSGLLVWQEKGRKRVLALLCFLLSGILGVFVLGGSVKEPLLVLFSGLFGVPSLLFALMTRGRIPAQVNHDVVLERSRVQTVLWCVLAGPIFTVLPALGPSQAALMVSQVRRERSEENYIVSTGCLNTLHILVGLFTVYAIGKSRSGVIVAMKELIDFSAREVWLLVGWSLVVIGVVTILTILLARVIAEHIIKVNERLLHTLPLIGIVALVIIFSGGFGLFVLVVASAVGLMPLLGGVRRSNVMGVLILPTIVHYLI